MKRSIWIALGVAAAVAGWIASGHFADDVGTRDTAPLPTAAPAAAPAPAAAGRPFRVRVREIAAEERTDEIILFGRTEANRKVDLRTETAGRVARHHVRKGDWVERGARLLTLAPEERPARLEEARAALEHAGIAYEAARSLSQKAFRGAVQVAEARADLEKARAAVEAARLDLERTTLAAPFAGTVEALPLEVGAYARTGDVAARIIDADPLLLVGEIAERDVPRVRIGETGRARLVGGVDVEGRVRFLSRVGGEATRTFRIEVEVANPGGALVEGLTAELRVRAGVSRAHRVSPAVLTLSERGELGVKAVADDGTVTFHPARIVADTEAGIWLAGLPERVRVITIGQEFVRAGEKVDAVIEEPGGRS